MRQLLDTHAFLWWLDADPRLPGRLRQIIADPDNTIYVSAASAWEICAKARIGKLPGALDVAADVGGAIASQGFVSLPITVAHAERAGGLAGPHRDPFDRLLIAQSLIENLPIMSNDRAFDGFGVKRLWA